MLAFAAEGAVQRFFAGGIAFTVCHVVCPSVAKMG
jgi:hypothetical protein